MKFNPFKRTPDPAVAALQERLEAAQKIADPAEKYMALGAVMNDAMDGAYLQTLAPLQSENYYPTMLRSSGIAAVIAGGAALCFAAPLAAVAVVMLIGGGVGGLALGIGTLEYKRYMGSAKEYKQILEAVSAPLGEAEKTTTNVAVTQSPGFAEFSKKYPTLSDFFREEARKEKIDALPAPVAAALLGDKPKDKPGMSL